jgi:carboxypeptidase family protein/TonB-dependent receptor-like protein
VNNQYNFLGRAVLMSLGRMNARRSRRYELWLQLLLVLFGAAPTFAQTTADLQGRIFDTSGAVIPGATVTVRDPSSGFLSSVATDAEGRYHVQAIPVGACEVTASAAGFRSEEIASLTLEVGRTVVRDFHLAPGSLSEAVIVRSELPLLDRATSTLGHVVAARTIQEIPLNGRRFVNLGALVPGSVAPSQSGFSTTPIRGTGALAFNTSGNREEAVAYVVNGVTTNNLTFGSIGFPPPVASIQEFKVDNSTFSAEYGHVSGAIVNLITRSGADRFRADTYEFFRNDALDAKNFFEFTSPEPHLFERNQFGGSVGGPMIRGRMFFFATYEGFRQRQGVDLNSLVLSDDQRAAATDPVTRRLLPLIPRANVFDADGTPRFVGSGDASVDEHTWTADVRYNAGARDRVQLFYGRQQVDGVEPAGGGTSIPGFGQKRSIWKSTLTVNETHVFGAGLLNEARFGQTMQDGSTFPAAALNPVNFGIENGVTRPIGLPQITVAGSLNFGGPSALPQGRKDTLYLFNDAVTYVTGRHSMRFGGEYRRFLNNNFAEGTGQFNFPNVAAFLTGTANAFSITLGERRSHITQDALAFFAQDRFEIGSSLTLDLGLRYEWHVTPTERDDQFVVFDAKTASLVRVGADIESIYQQNNKNFEPRLGFAWTPSADGRTVVRGAYGWAVDQPSTTVVRDTPGNPPFAIPLSASGAIPLASAVSLTRPIGLGPMTVDPQFRNASLRSWNVNTQRQLGGDLAAAVGYFGSSGRNLRLSRNINQPVNGIRPFPALSPSSPIRPGAPLGNITQVESAGFSRYHAVWVSATKRLSGGLTFDASYTWSKSLDTNSLNSSGFAIQDSHDIPDEYGLSDFDARQRFVISATYELPFAGHALTRGWQLAAIVQGQSGNPINIVTSNSTLNGVPNSVRPDLVAPLRTIGSVDQWFDPSSFAAVNRFGNLGRNVVIGPSFHNTDVSVMKAMTVAQRYRVQFRVDAFDVFNHPNFGPPGNVVGTPTFGKISRTRLPTGEAGSSRQIQLGAKLWF